ncbi:DUF3575 domain-containing protein [Corallococcus silvisoli]|uniref:DUF3575 domain-containing protein n=1 Tax=Corallococcus silvisoli TaxID=2697031 RepID=UPI001377EF86|nr:DUF3575 domain-containing protein [Corallococcus silvisoli]NBD12614.1 DUF3575 domain-containing protein [Corallococcus silvisoli]
MHTRHATLASFRVFARGTQGERVAAMINRHVARSCVLAGFFTAPGMALAQEETARAPRPGESARSRGALAIGIRGHSLSVAASPDAPTIAGDFEYPVMRYLTVFGGLQLGVDMNALGLQAGGRLYPGGQPFQGFFLSVQAEGAYFDGAGPVSGTRKSVGGLLGYSQVLGNRWSMSLGAGADVSQTRSETVVPPDPVCVLFTPCLLTHHETRVETQEGVRPLVRVGAAYRF